MSPISRRRYLQATALVGASAVAGCMGGSKGADQSGTDESAGAQSGSEPTSGAVDNLTLDTLSVGGSPGGSVPLQPSGKVALLDFFATWCAPCKPEMENLRAVRDRFESESVSMISITQETDPELVRAFWREYDGTWPVAMDTQLQATREYDVKNIPTIVIYTPAGEEVWRHVGLAGEDAIAKQLEIARSEGE